MKIEEYQRNYELEKNYWWFVGVRRIIHNLLGHLIKKNSATKILDVGCGTGALLEEITKNYPDSWGVDIAPEALRFCKERGLTNVQIADAKKLPFDEQYFDVVIALAIIEHIDDDEAFLREINRVLKPGGIVIIITSSFPFLWSMHDVANHHFRRYYLKEFIKKVETNGFTTMQASHFNFFLFPALSIGLIFHRLIHGLDPSLSKRIMPQPPRIVNYLLTRILEFEAMLILKISFPFGISMVGSFRKVEIK